VSSDDADGFADFVLGAIDVAKGTLLQALSEGVVFFVSDVLVSLAEQLLGAMQTARVIEAGINRRMIVQVLTIIDRGLLDFSNSSVDLIDGFLFFAAQVTALAVLKMSASVTKISQSVKIGRMFALRTRIVGTERENQGKKQRGNRKSGHGLHRHEFSLELS
jgi:hypothetical protein